MIDAIEYGNALFEISEELGKAAAVRDDIEAASKLLAANESYVKLVDSPALPKSERTSLIGEAFGSLDVHLVNLLKMLAERHSAYLFPKIRDAFCARYDDMMGIERVEAISAVMLSAEQVARLTARLSSKLGKTVVIKNTVDPSVLGGIKLRYAGIQIDGTIKARLDSFSEALLGIVI